MARRQCLHARQIIPRGVAFRCAQEPRRGCTSKPAPPESSFWLCKHTWRRAAANTTRCLVGCSVGDLSALYLLSAYAPELSVATAVGISCTSGIATSMALETVTLRVTEGLAWRLAWRTAAGMSLLSMVSMELAENAVEVYLTGGTPGSMCGATFWAAIPPALLAGFLTPLPYVRAARRSRVASPGLFALAFYPCTATRISLDATLTIGMCAVRAQNYYMLRRYGRSCH